MRAEESGGSECRPVTGRIGVEEVERRHLPRESGQTSARSFFTRTAAMPRGELRRGASSGARALRLDLRLAGNQLVQLPSTSEEFADPYREGMAGGQTAQGEIFAAAAHPLAERQSLGREASDGEPR